MDGIDRWTRLKVRHSTSDLVNMETWIAGNGGRERRGRRGGGGRRVRGRKEEGGEEGRGKEEGGEKGRGEERWRSAGVLQGGKGGRAERQWMKVQRVEGGRRGGGGRKEGGGEDVGWREREGGRSEYSTLLLNLADSTRVSSCKEREDRVNSKAGHFQDPSAKGWSRNEHFTW